MNNVTYRLEPVTTRKYRVIQWFTGQIACEQVRLMARNPQFEIVGAVCHNPKKDGVDLGQLAGIGPLGITVTANPEDVLALDADIALINPIDQSTETLETIIHSGKNAISIMGPWDVTLIAEHTRLDAAARAAGVSFAGAGNMPGMLNDVVPAMLSGWTADVRSVWTRERSYQGNYASKEVLDQILGYGWPIGEHGPGSSAGEALIAGYVGAFDQAHHALAITLGAVNDKAKWETRLTDYEAVAAPETYAIEACGLVIKKGTVAGFRYVITSFIDGEPWAIIEVEHTSRLALGPAWRQSIEDHEWTIRIAGQPNLEMTFGADLRGQMPGDLEHTMDPLVKLNAARMVNLVPSVVEASPGFKTFAELPIITALNTRLGRCA